MTPAEISAILTVAKAQGILPMGDPAELAAMLNSARPKIRLPGDNRELGQFAREVGEILCKEQLYRRDTVVVTINTEDRRTDPVSGDWLRTWAENHLVCFKDKEFGTGATARQFQVVKTMNLDTARGTLAAPQFLSQLKKISRVNPIRLPILTKANRIDLAPLGYCEDSGIFTLENELVYDENMTLERALELIRGLLSEFPFLDSGRSLSVQVAAMMTVFAVSLLPRTAARPGFIYTANDSDAGKTLAVKVAVIPVLGAVRSRAFPRKEESRKVLDQLAMDGASHILFDNVKGTLGGEDIEAFMSSARWSGRILGEKGGFDVENVTTCFFTGNDSKPTRDMAQRCLFVELFLEQVDSSRRKIGRVLNDGILAGAEVRSEICSAMWTMVRHWDAKGRPSPSSMMPKCPEWSQTIAAIVEAAGFGDPCAKPQTAVTGFARDMEALVRAMVRENESQRWTFAEVVTLAKAESLFEEEPFIAGLGSDDAEAQKSAVAEKSAFARKLASFGAVSESPESRADGRLFAAEDGSALRFRALGKGHARRYTANKQ